MSFLINPHGFGPPLAPIAAYLGSKLQGWYDADQQTESDAAGVTNFTDRSGNGHDFTCDPTTQPIMRYNDVNSNKGLEFVGGNTGDWMNCSTGLMDGETEGSFFAVVYLASDAPAGNFRGPLLDDFGSDTQDSHFVFSDGNIYDTFGTTSRKTVGNPTPTMVAWRIFSAHSAAGDWRAYLDGTLLYSTATNTVNFGTSVRSLGRNNLNYRLSFHIAELIICNDVLTTAQRETVEGYMAHRFGLEANLPIGHTYKSAAPF